MNYRIYRNLTRKCWSIQTKVQGKWKVTSHAVHFAAADCFFKISEAGRQRVLQTKRKNVHSWCIAKEIMPSNALRLDFWPRISYNPYYNGHFACENQPISTASLVLFNGEGAFLVKDMPTTT